VLRVEQPLKKRSISVPLIIVGVVAVCATTAVMMKMGGTTKITSDAVSGNKVQGAGERKGAQQKLSTAELASYQQYPTDCVGNTIDSGYHSWIGDNYCDDGGYWGYNFDCREFNFDEGDCGWYAEDFCEAHLWGSDLNSDMGECLSHGGCCHWDIDTNVNGECYSSLGNQYIYPSQCREGPKYIPSLECSCGQAYSSPYFDVGYGKCDTYTGGNAGWCVYDGACDPCSKQCSAECGYTLKGDGVCNSNCNTEGCGYDGGDCNSQSNSEVEGMVNDNLFAQYTGIDIDIEVLGAGVLDCTEGTLGEVTGMPLKVFEEILNQMGCRRRELAIEEDMTVYNSKNPEDVAKLRRVLSERKAKVVADAKASGKKLVPFSKYTPGGDAVYQATHNKVQMIKEKFGWDDFTSAVTYIADETGVSGVVEDMGDFVEDAGGAVGGFVGDVVDDVGSAFEDVGEAFGEIASDAVAGLEAVADAVVEAADYMANGIVNLAEAVVDGLVAIGEFLVDLAVAVWNCVEGMVTANWEDLIGDAIAIVIMTVLYPVECYGNLVYNALTQIFDSKDPAVSIHLGFEICMIYCLSVEAGLAVKIETIFGYQGQSLCVKPFWGFCGLGAYDVGGNVYVGMGLWPDIENIPGPSLASSVGGDVNVLGIEVGVSFTYVNSVDFATFLGVIGSAAVGVGVNPVSASLMQQCYSGWIYDGCIGG
jgi:hypothetical protein